MTVWVVEVDRLGGAGYEDWTDFVQPWPQASSESVAVARSGRAKVSFTDPPATPKKGWGLRITRNLVEAFEGFVRGVEHRDVGSTNGPRLERVTGVDFDSLLDDDVVPHVYRSAQETAGERIAHLVTTYGTHGITAGVECQDIIAMPGGSDGRPEQEFGPSTLREAIRKVTKISGGAVYVDFDKRIHHFLVENDAAPFGLSDTPNDVTTFDYHGFTLDEDDTPRVDEVVVFGAEGIEVTRTVADPPAAEHRRRAPLVDDKLTSVAQAEAAGDAFLAENAGRRSGSLKTLEPGLLAGMDVQITHQGHGLVAETFRIHTVSTTFDGPDDSAVYEIGLGDAPVDLAELLGGSGGARTVAREAAAAADEGIRRIADLQAAGANLVVNSSFESASGQGGWSVNAPWAFGFAPIDPQFAFAGSKVARAAAAGVSVLALTHDNIVPVDRLADYWMSAWTFMRAYTSGTATLWLDEYNITTALIASTEIVSIAAADTAWVRHSIHMGPNDQLGRRAFHASTAFVRLRIGPDGTSTFTLDTDGWQIERGTLLTAYAPAPQELVDGQVGTTQIADDSITTPKVVANAIVAGKIAASAITTDKLDAAAVTTDKLNAGAVTAAKIAAKAVTADKLNVGGFALLTNPGFEDAGTGWTTSIPPGSVVAFETSVNAKSGSGSCRLTNGSTVGARITSINFPVNEGDKIVASVYARATLVGSTLRMRIKWTAWDGVVVSDPHTPFALTQGYVRYQFAFTAPTGATFAAVELTNETADNAVRVDDVTVALGGSFVNEPGEVVIDATGIAVTNGKITVTNAGATVVIDGTSNMFKIVTTGTMTHSTAADADTEAKTVLSGLGLPPETPAFIAYLTEGLSPSNVQNRVIGYFLATITGFVASTSGGSPNQRMRYLSWYAEAITDAPFGVPNIAIRIVNAHSVTHGIFMRYHILKEAAV